MRGDDVKQLQSRLKEKGYDPGQIDGIFGRKTQRAVKQFQREHDLKADGIAGKKTFAALGLQFD